MTRDQRRKVEGLRAWALACKLGGADPKDVQFEDVTFLLSVIPRAARRRKTQRAKRC